MKTEYKEFTSSIMNELQRLANHFSAYGGKERLKQYEDSLMEDSTASNENLRHVCNILKKSKMFPSYGEILNCLFSIYPETKIKKKIKENEKNNKCNYCDGSGTIEVLDNLNYIQLMICRCNNNPLLSNYPKFNSITDLPIDKKLTPIDEITQLELAVLKNQSISGGSP